MANLAPSVAESPALGLSHRAKAIAAIVAGVAAAFMIEHPLRADDRATAPAAAVDSGEGTRSSSPTGTPAD